MSIAGPIVTLGAVAALATGILLADITLNPNPQPPAPPSPAAVAAPAPAAPVPPPPVPPPPVPFGPQQDFVADISTKTDTLPLHIRVVGDTADAYACDNAGIETWLSGSAVGGVLKLTSTDRTARLDGRHRDGTVVGTLWIGDRHWDFTAVPGATDAF
ncbi:MULTISPECIES: hypothetical protein [Mycolicibacterium]|uniref:hypothetical protein n=1 Tax=Mycolicibacterium TaxID=1866885 RepID=UPI001F1CF295|nr:MULTISPECIES: hypothetical protein [Mycolicibacterium]WND54807.1 hypothetical protein QQA43_18765 [Mycolicibacterium vanbaalenii]